MIKIINEILSYIQIVITVKNLKIYKLILIEIKYIIYPQSDNKNF